MDQNPESHAFRFARTVNPSATKPGHDLATLVFQLCDEAFLLYCVEGWRNDTLTLIGMSTNFKKTCLFNCFMRGDLLEKLKRIPFTLCEREFCVTISDTAAHQHADGIQVGASPSQIDVLEAKVILSPEGDAAIVQLKMKEDEPQQEGPPVNAWITCYRPAWLMRLIVAVCATGIRCIVERCTAGTVLHRRVEFALSHGFAPLCVEGLLECGSRITDGPFAIPGSPVISGASEAH
ncbi:MAG TPA: hypothetical protein VKF14_15935 [Candidatus Dormibacteraeota bacterium]|nr:hypothetical protein [Candidatus Dormibacteraeota bacterium]